MNFGELCQDVITITNRPDLISEIQLAVRIATSKFHMIDFWMRDRAERILIFPQSDTRFTVDLLVTFANWRKFSYIRPYDQVSANPINKFINEISPSAIFDEYSQQKTDIFYVAGNLMNMKCKESQNAFLIGWFKYPNVQISSYASWIADMYPAIIVEEAAGRIYNSIGQVDEANKYIDPQRGSIYNPINGHLAILRTNELEATAR